MNDKGMFETKCAKCGKQMYTYAKDRLGTLPKVYCGKICEGQANYDRKFDTRFK